MPNAKFGPDPLRTVAVHTEQINTHKFGFIYTVSGKKVPMYVCFYLCLILTDLTNSFTDKLSSKFVVKS